MRCTIAAMAVLAILSACSGRDSHPSRSFTTECDGNACKCVAMEDGRRVEVGIPGMNSQGLFEFERNGMTDKEANAQCQQLLSPWFSNGSSN